MLTFSVLRKYSFLHSEQLKLLLRRFTCEVYTSQLIISLESSYFGSRETVPVTHQNSQTSKEIVVDISLFLGPYVLY